MTREPRSQLAWIESALDRYERPLLRFVTRMTGNVDLARDVVQDGFLKLCKTDRDKVEHRLAGWLFTVCRNRALDVMKKEGRMGRIDDAQAVPDPASRGGPAQRAMLNETHNLVLEVLAELPADQQEAFRLKFEDQLTYREIGQVMGRSLGSVSKLLTSALGSVRDRLRGSATLVQEG